MSNFELASRVKLRFETVSGLRSVEDLWELPLQSNAGKANLNDIALGLHKELRSITDVVSFVDETAKADPTVQLRFDIVKHIIDIRKQENAEKLARADKAATKQILLAALERKRTGALETMTEAQLLEKINQL